MLIDSDFIWFIAMVTWLPFRILSLIVRKRKEHTLNFSGELLLNLFFFYLVALVGVTIFPIPIGIPMYNDFFQLNYNYIPFKSIMGSFNHFWYMVALRNIGGNLILLVPFGFLLPLIWKRANTLGKVVASGFLLSLSIELLQLIIPGRAADVDDLILNTLGLFFGFLAFKLFHLLLGLITKGYKPLSNNSRGGNRAANK